MILRIRKCLKTWKTLLIQLRLQNLKEFQSRSTKPLKETLPFLFLPFSPPLYFVLLSSSLSFFLFLFLFFVFFFFFFFSFFPFFLFSSSPFQKEAAANAEPHKFPENKPVRGLDLLDVSPKDIAQHLTLVSVELLKMIQPDEFVFQLWGKKSNPLTAKMTRNLQRMIDRFNKVQLPWIIEFLNQNDPNLPFFSSPVYLDSAFNFLTLIRSDFGWQPRYVHKQI